MHLSIRRKIMSGYAAIGLLAGIAVALGIFNLHQTDERYSYLLDHEQTIALLATRMVGLSHEQVTNTRSYLQTGDETFLSRRLEVQREMASIHDQLSALVTTEQDKEQLDNAWQLTTTFQNSADDLIQIRDTVDMVTLRRLYQSRMGSVDGKMIDAYRQWAELKTRQAADVGTELQRRTRQAIILLAALAAASIIIGVTLGALISRGLVVSLHQVLASVEAVERGDLRREVSIRSGDEIELLAKHVNRMRQALLELERQRSDFTSLIAHELRTPIATIYSFSMLLSREGHLLGRDELNTYLGAVSRQADHLVRLVDDFVTVERLDSGRLSYALAPMHLSALLEEVSNDFRRSHPAEAVIVQPSNGPDVIHADPMRLKQALTHLVDSAVHLAPDSPVLLGWSGDDPQGIRITVSDQGLEIPSDQVETLFAKFGRVRNAKNGAVQGSGLGLYIAKRIVEAHGGSIRVETTPTQGATFCIILPAVIEEGGHQDLPRTKEPASNGHAT